MDNFIDSSLFCKDFMSQLKESKKNYEEKMKSLIKPDLIDAVAAKLDNFLNLENHIDALIIQGFKPSKQQLKDLAKFKSMLDGNDIIVLKSYKDYKNKEMNYINKKKIYMIANPTYMTQLIFILIY